MSLSLKPISEQVLFITGASKGVGLAVVRMAVEKGARVFMVDSDENALQMIQDEMRAKSLPTAYAVAVVSERDQLQVAADQCIATFGTIDTWINSASVSLYARLLETDDSEAKALFETNFWGVVNGCAVAAGMLRHSGGAIINLGGSCHAKALPIQGIYCASKEAVKAFTNSFREEMKEEKYPVSVSLVLPETSDRVYLPALVAESVLKCASEVTKESVIKMKFVMPDFRKYLPRRKTESDLSQTPLN